MSRRGCACLLNHRSFGESLRHINPQVLQNPSPNPVSDVELGEPVGGSAGAATVQGAPVSSGARSLPSLLTHLYAWTGTLSFKEDCSVSKTRSLQTTRTLKHHQ